MSMGMLTTVGGRMPNLLSTKKEMGFEDKGDGSMAETISHNYSMDNRENVKRRKRERRGQALKFIVFMVFAALALAAFFLSIHDHIAIRKAFIQSGPKASKQFSRSNIDVLQAQIEKLNMTLTQRVDNHNKEENAHHQTLNNTMHVKHSELIQAVKSIEKEFDTNLAQLNSTMLSQFGSKYREIQSIIANLNQSMSQIRNNVQDNKKQLDSRLSSLQTNIQSLRTQLSKIETAASERDRESTTRRQSWRNNDYKSRQSYNGAFYNRILNPWLLVIGVYSVIMMI